MILSPNTFYTGYLNSQFSSFDLFSDDIKDCRISLYSDSSMSGYIELLSGKIFDRNNLFLTSYVNNADIDLELSFDTGRYSFWKNSNLVSCNKLWNTGGGYIDKYKIENLSNEDLDINISFYGSYPTVTFSDLYTEDLNLFTGYYYLSSPSYLSYIYSSITDVQYGTGYLSNSGFYVISGRNLSSGSTLDLDFSFDFGNILSGITVSYNDILSRTGYINAVIQNPIYTSFISGTEEVFVQYQDIDISSNWDFGTNFEVYLQYIGRSGERTVTGTGIGTGYYSGTVNGSGYIYGDNLTGIIYDYNVTGVGTGQIFTYATGDIVYSYMSTVTGIEGGNLSTGVLYGTLTGTIFDGSGYYIFNQNVYGTPAFSVWHGGINVAPVATYTGSVLYTGYLSTFMYKLSSGQFVGIGTEENISGSIQRFNLITGDPKDFYRDSDSFNNIYNNYTNFAELGYRSGDYVRSSQKLYLQDGFTDISARVIYTRDVEGSLRDYVNLYLVNEYEQKNYELIGYTR